MTAVAVLLVALASAFVLTEVCRRVGLPRVLGQVVAGMLLASFFFSGGSAGADKSLLAAMADIGILLLFFFIGLEINLHSLKKQAPRAGVIAAFNTLLPMSAGFAFSKYFLGLGDAASLVVGVALSVSAQALALDVLDELGKVRSRVGQIVIAAGLVDDVLELGLVAVVLALVHVAGEALSLQRLALDFLFFALSLVVLRSVIVPRVLRETEEEHSPAMLVMGALVITLLMAALADSFSIGGVMGALFSGILVRHFLVTESRKPWEERELARVLHHISFGFFVPLFFVFVGLNTQFSALVTQWPVLLVLCAIAFIGTIGGTALAVKFTGGSWSEGLTAGWGVNSKGDTELVIASLALQNAVFTQEVFSLIVAVAVTTTVVSPIVFKKMLQEMKAEKSAGGRRK